jgi:hypothetical protein
MGCFTSSSETNTNLPDWLKGPTQGIAGAAMGLMGQKYKPYGREMVAGMTGTQNDAMSYIRKMLGDPNSFTTPRLIDNIPGTGGPGSPGGSIQDYMNPYIGETLQPTLRNIQEQTAHAMQGVDAKSNFTGGFRDTGSALQRAQTENLGGQAIGDATNRAYSDAFNTAMGERNSDINRLMQNRQAGLGAAGEMFDMGSKQQATQQMRDTAAFSEFLRKQGFDMNKIQQIADIFAKLNSSTPMSTTTTPSTANQIFGGLGALGGLGSLFGGLF